MNHQPPPNPPASGIDPNRQYVIGTAGHIDHGKTALVKALTGIDTDRLPEEKSRGISIDLGFAHFSDHITIIDVPGHERLIKNMVAGVSTIDLVLFVIAADDGVMPQSREHLDIINLLQIQQGIFVITKTDLVKEDWLTLVEEDIRALLQETPFENAPILRTSAARNIGIEELKQTVVEKLAHISARQELEIFRLPVDRVFSARGFGTVVTGTVLGGELRIGDQVELQPVGLRLRVRGLQSHDREVAVVRTGFRAAVNLAGIEVADIRRGMVLTRPDVYQAVKIINAWLALLESSPIPLKNNQRVRLHIHTLETFARVIMPSASRMEPGERAFVQLRLEEAVHAAYQDRFIIRQYSPQRTIGGGVVLETNPFRYQKKYAKLFRDTLNSLESDDHQRCILAAFDHIHCRPITLWELKSRTNLPLSALQKDIKDLTGKKRLFSEALSGKTVYFSRQQLQKVLERVAGTLEKYHQTFPGRPGLSEAELSSTLDKFFTPESVRKALNFGLLEGQLGKENHYYRLMTFTPELSEKHSEAYLQLETAYREAGFAPPTVKEVMAQFALSQKEFKELIRLLRTEGKLIYVDETLMFHSSVLPKIEEALREFFRKKPVISVAEFKEITATTRKHTIPLLEYLDKHGITRREGDVRRSGEKLGVQR